MTGPDVPEGRCMVCRAAWGPCRRCKGKAVAAKAAATMAANGKTRNIPKPTRAQMINLSKDPDLYPHKTIARRRHDAES